MSTASTLVGRIVGEWADRLARGEPVAADDALALYPELSSQLRPLLSALGAVADVRVDPSLPVLTGFRVIRELGRGGMGVVYEAEDEALGRRVAVKVLPPHLLGRPEHVARFRQEARAAAGLHHTHVVPVFGVGECGGAHFIVMQVIDGRPLAPGTPLPPSRVAEVGAKLADALAAAHARGVLHRDVKPGNVLIDAAGEPWLSDFGLARVDTADAVTDPTGFVGTLRYAAPERFNGTSDARSDIYSLGLTLYELAAGRPAFDATDRAELTRQASEAAPPRPRAVNPAVPRDLETVLLKAIARDPAHRYQSAAAFADDLKRVAGGRPILAKRIGPVGRLWRWAKRHPVIAGLTAAVFLSLAGGLGGVYWQWRQSEERRAEADRAFQDAREAVDECFLAATEHPDFQGPGLQPAKEELLRRARKYYERFLAQRGDDPSVQADVAKARLAIGTITVVSGQYADAIPELRAALDLYDQHGDHFATARCLRLLGHCHMSLGRSAEAGEANTAALARLEPLLATNSAARLEFGRVTAQEARRLTEGFQNADAERVFRRGLEVTADDTDTAVRLVKTRLHYGLSLVLKRLNRVAESGDQLKRMDDLAQGLLKLDPDRDEYVEEAGFARKAIGSFALIHTVEGKKYGWWHIDGYRDAVAYYRRLHARHETVFRYHFNLAISLGSFGLSLWIEQKNADSEAAFRESLVLWEPLVRNHGDNPDVIDGVSNTRQDFASLLRTLGRLTEADEQLIPAVADLRQLVARYDKQMRYREGLAIALHNLGVVRHRQRQDAAALRLFTEAIDLLAPLQGAEGGNRQFNWNARNFCYSRGMLHWLRGDREAAAADLAQVKDGENAWQAEFRRAFRGDITVAAEMEKLGGIDAAAVIAVLSTHPELPVAERERLQDAAVKLLKAGEKQFADQVYRRDFLTRRELDPLAGHPDFQALRTSAAALDRMK